MTASDIDHIINHWSLKKSRKRWRWIAIILGVVALIAFFGKFGGPAPVGEHVARISVFGMITGNQKQLDLLKEAATDDTVKAVILRIDSPGGTTVGSEALYLAIREAAEKKPVVAVMDTVAASGGYIAALATDHIVARSNTVTGSIGVIFTFPEVSQLLATVGVKIEEIKSGELKAEPGIHKPVSPAVRAHLDELVADGFTWFKGLVKERREMTDAEVIAVSNGRVFTGRMALKEKLIDEIGGEDEALAWLAKEKNISADLKVLDWQPPKPWAEQFFSGATVNAVLNRFSIGAFGNIAERTTLDGLLVLWHPVL
jgi:protease IV